MSGLDDDRIAPTPWHYDASTGCVRDANGAAVATGTAPGNGRLLAPAPELFAALKTVCTEFAQGHPDIKAGAEVLARAVPQR